LSDDVVIVGRTPKSAGRTIADTDIKIDLGPGVTLKGRGLDVVLNGDVRLTSDNKEALQAHGTLNVVKGTYRAYGRKLAIEKGRLLFNGPLGNPTLDILAMQRNKEVEAGVAVTGTVLAPRITLVSEPNVPDSEKLAWLVLGRALDTTTTADMNALQTAAAALLTENGSGGVTANILEKVGLDDIGLKTSQATTPNQGTQSNQAGTTNVQQHIVTVGKQISDKLYVGYEQGVDATSSVLHLRYTLSKRMTLEGEAGTRSAIAVFFNFLFD
jgi:translocation and assembly module TamB